MSILTHGAICREMDRANCPDPKDPLVIAPLLDSKQIGESSVDVRLGHQFIVLRRAAVTHIDATERGLLQRNLHRSQHHTRVSLHQPFIIHPGQLVLGATIEYLSIPKH